MARALIFFAPGLEECEGLIVVDVLRRSHVDVDIAAVGGDLDVTSSHDVRIRCDILAEDADVASYDAVVLPGGMPGTTNLEASETVRKACLEMDAGGKLVCAICAAPSALAAFGILKGEDASVFPGFEGKLEEHGTRCTGEQVTEVGNHITGQAMGAATLFGLAIASRLAGPDEAERVRGAICYKG